MASNDPFPPLRTITSTADETRRLGVRFGRHAVPGVIVLEGGLGAGKTTFIKGLAEGLGFSAGANAVTSPTFVLAREYPGRLTLIHIDLYRLDSVGSETADWLAETFERDAVTAVEWGERAAHLLPRSHLHLKFAHLDDGRRLIESQTRGPAAFGRSS